MKICVCKDGAQSSDAWYKQLNISQQPLTNWKAGGGTDFLHNFTIAQRSWIFQYDSATKKTGCSEDKEPTSLLEKARMSCLKVRTFFYIKCILHNEYLPAGQIINQCFYRDVLKCFKANCVIKHLWPHKLVVHYQWRNFWPKSKSQ